MFRRKVCIPHGADEHMSRRSSKGKKKRFNFGIHETATFGYIARKRQEYLLWGALPSLEMPHSLSTSFEPAQSNRHCTSRRGHDVETSYIKKMLSKMTCCTPPAALTPFKTSPPRQPHAPKKLVRVYRAASHVGTLTLRCNAAMNKQGIQTWLKELLHRTHATRRAWQGKTHSIP